jgi:hypothetical protein
MKQRSLFISTATGFLLVSNLSFAQPSTPAAPPSADPKSANRTKPVATSPAVGLYNTRGSRNTEMVIERDGENLKISLSGGSDTKDGAAMAGTCSMVAVGQLKGNKILATLVPFKTQTNEVKAEDVRKSPATIAITFSGPNKRFDKANLTAQSSGICGVRNVLSGTFYRSKP